METKCNNYFEAFSCKEEQENGEIAGRGKGIKSNMGEITEHDETGSTW